MGQTFTHRAIIAGDFRVEFTFADGESVECRWFPARPAHLTRGMLRRYRRARGAFLKRLAASTGLRVALVEL